MATKFASLQVAILSAKGNLQYHSKQVHSGFWQGTDIRTKSEAAMREIMYYSMDVDLRGEERLEYYRAQVMPNLPWADDHFEERVCGEPLNPGKTWEAWPYALRADSSRDESGQFNHGYMERYWPKYAGMTPGGKIIDFPVLLSEYFSPRNGIRNPYGDLNDLIDLFIADPLTRQGYLPIYFPEDTGLKDRKPCTLGYMFFMRDGKFDITYTIRSCDFIRHFRDDIYMTIRLQLWFLQQLRKRDPLWKNVQMGRFRMEIGSLHLFLNDWIAITGGGAS